MFAVTGLLVVSRVLNNVAVKEVETVAEIAVAVPAAENAEAEVRVVETVAVAGEQAVAVARVAEAVPAEQQVDVDNNIVLEYFNKYCNNVTTEKIKTS